MLDLVTVEHKQQSCEEFHLKRPVARNRIAGFMDATDCRRDSTVSRPVESRRPSPSIKLVPAHLLLHTEASRCSPYQYD
jgi:hypothetical protein